MKKQEDKRIGLDPRQAFIEDLDQEIYAAWKDSDEVYGAPRIAAKLAEQGMKVNRKTVAKRMKATGIEGISPRRFAPVTTIESTKSSHLLDLVKRLFDAGELNRVGSVILPICVLVKAGCTCVRSEMDTPAGWLVGRWTECSPLTL